MGTSTSVTFECACKARGGSGREQWQKELIHIRVEMRKQTKSLYLVLISQKLTSWKKLWRCRLTAANGNGAWKRIQAHCNVSECVATLPCRASARSLRWLSCRLWQRPSYVCGVEVLGKPVLGTPVILLLLFIRWSVEVLFPFYCMSASWKASYNLLFCLFFNVRLKCD